MLFTHSVCCLHSLKPRRVLSQCKKKFFYNFEYILQHQDFSSDASLLFGLRRDLLNLVSKLLTGADVDSLMVLNNSYTT